MKLFRPWVRLVPFCTFRLAAAALRLHFWILRKDDDEFSRAALYYFTGFIQGLLPPGVSIQDPEELLAKHVPGTALYVWPPTCSQCGQRWAAFACGPSHAIIAKEIADGIAQASEK